jgi:dihydroxyacetone kinase DhaKLM complex PTS-EIIA-like component DhaM
MLRFYAQSFVSATCTLSQIVHILNRGEGLRDSHAKEIGEALGELSRECEKLDLPMTNAQLKRIKNGIDDGSFFNVAATRQQLFEVINRLWDELESHIFYQLESSKAKFYEKPEEFWGAEVSKAFPSALPELGDAARCYALGRNTACVFHLMRALEIALSCMAKVFGVPSNHTNWHNIIEQIESKIRDLSKAKPRNWKEDQEFYSQAASYFMVLKDAWRNYTAHARGRYGEEEAMRIMNNVCGFMKKLSAKLSE